MRIYRGVSMAGLEFAPTTLPGVQGTNFTRNAIADYTYAASKGFDVVRVAFLWERVQPTVNGALSSTYLGYIQNNIDWAAANGLKVILDCHNYGRCIVDGTNRKIGGVDGNLTIAHFADLWDRLSEEFKDNSTVLGYDLMNECHDMTTPTTSSNYKTTSTVTLLYQAAVDTIRANGDQKYCIVELDNWAGGQNFTSTYGANPDPWINDVTGKTIYSCHYYFDNDHSGAYAQAFASSNNTAITGDLTPFFSWGQTKGVICYVGEYGVPNTADWQVCLDTFLNLCNDYDVWATHWAMGIWYTSPTTLEPTSSYTVDRLQMDEVTDNLGYSLSGFSDLVIKAVDTMKKNKDKVNSQLSTAEKTDLINRLATMGLTHICISVPLDTNAQMVAEANTPSPRTIEAEAQEWHDLIHAAGLKVLNRGTFCGTEAIYDFPYYKDGSGDVLPIGTSSSATTDGETTWCGRIRRYILTTIGTSHWEEGDIFAPIPEGTSHAFDGNAFWEDDSSNNTNYQDAFVQFKATADAAFTSISKPVTFESHNNFSEWRSGWLGATLYNNQNLVGFDYYGRYQGAGYNSVADYITDLNAIYSATGKAMVQGEWGAIGGEALPNFSCQEDRMAYLINFYKTYGTSLVDTGKLIGFNYWGGWEGQNTSILYKDGSNNYQLNAEGKILASFYKGSGEKRVPVITGGTTTDTYRY